MEREQRSSSRSKRLWKKKSPLLLGQALELADQLEFRLEEDDWKELEAAHATLETWRGSRIKHRHRLAGLLARPLGERNRVWMTELENALAASVADGMGGEDSVQGEAERVLQTWKEAMPGATS